MASAGKLGAFWSSTTQYDSANLLTNPSFETGSLTPWSGGTIISTDHYDGLYACSVTGQTLKQATSAASVSASDVIQVRCAAKASGTPSAAATLELDFAAVTTSDEILGAGDGVATSFSGTLTNYPVVPKTVTISYTIGSTVYTATDDGAGTITGTSVSGTITYSTGAWALTFTTAPDNGTNITADYDKKLGSTSTTIPTSTASWTRFALIHQAPTSTDHIVVLLTVESGDTYYVDDFQVSKLEQVGGFSNWSLDISAETADVTAFEDNGWRAYIGTQKGWTGSADRFWGSADFFDHLTAGNPIYCVFYIDEDNDKRWEGLAQVTGVSPNTAVDAVVKETVNFQGIEDISYHTT